MDYSILIKWMSPFVNPLHTGRLFHCYMLDESICHCRGVGSIYRFYSFILDENPVSKQCMPRSGGLFHCYMLDEFTGHFRGFGSILTLLFLYFSDAM